MQRSRQAVTLAFALSACCGLPARASAQPAAASNTDSDRAQAEQYAAAAFEAYGRQEYAAAVALYQKAYALTPNADIILYNIARIYDSGLHDSKLAIDYYLRYAAAAGAAPNRIQISSQRIAELATGESNAAVPAGAGPTAAEANAAALAAAKDSAANARDVTSAAPQATSASSAQAPSPASSAPASSEWTARELTALTVGGIGVAGIGLGVVFGLSASAQADTWEQYCDGDVCSSQKGVDAAESAQRQARVATVSLTAGITLTALGTVLWFMGGPSEGPSENRSTAASLRLTPIAGDGELGGSLSGSF